MWEQGHHAEGRAHEQVVSRERGVHGDAPAGHTRAAVGRLAPLALSPLHAALTAALRQRVARRAARDHGTSPSLVGHLCERCLDAPALVVQPAPWGGEMGVCAACQEEPLASDEEPHAR